ncbi:ROK family protein [Alicyclobacillus sp.]|uniref:ROK family protein n=1 Tax=Alicyclobacillus sp. TaxID=61169 RepID=UPI0025BB6BA5|nr:ROK family protein [Alicyclobacillus sp.]MCL6517697.1 ROK family protein [Alicyclobacillus sp.]
MVSVGIDLGGTKLAACLLRSDGSVLAETTVPTQAWEGPEAVMARMEALIREMMERAPERVAAVGIGSPGPLDLKTGVVLSPPNLPGWDRVPLRDRMRAAVGLPVYLDNDANAAALAEFRSGAGAGADRMVYVTVSTGIGAGIVIDGRLYRGETGASGEFGHTSVNAWGEPCRCGNVGCLENYASGTAIAKRAEAVFGRTMPAAEVMSRASEGDQAAKGIVEEAFYALGIGLVNLTKLLNPRRIVIGGGVAQTGGPMLDTLRRIVNRHCDLEVEIRPAALGTRAGVIGAALLPWTASEGM